MSRKELMTSLIANEKKTLAETEFFKSSKFKKSIKFQQKKFIHLKKNFFMFLFLVKKHIKFFIRSKRESLN